MQDSKIDKVQSWKPPQNIQEVHRFLGFTGYYHYFIQRYLSIMRLLTELTKKSTPWHWGSIQQNTFETLRMKMCEKPVL
jgi:hypothetical protein